jgi:hypothetical protein
MAGASKMEPRTIETVIAVTIGPLNPKAKAMTNRAMANPNNK